MEHYGFLSIIPPVLAILLAVRTKNVLISLVVGLLFGTTVLANWNPILGATSIISNYVYVEIAKTWQAQSLANLLIIGAFVALISASGGAIAFAKLISSTINTRKKAELSMWFGGLFVWFSDSANSLLVGPIFQSIGDRMKVSREKFAYILDATSSPICALVPIISWGVYIMGLIQSELEAASITNITSWEVFVKAVPFQFYSWLTLAMVGYLAYTQFDFGPMYKAQKRAESGKMLRDGATPLRNTKELILPNGVKPNALTMILPLVTVLTVMFSIFVMNGFPFEQMPGTAIRQGIAMGFISGGIVCVLLSVKFGLMTFKQAETEVFDGMKGMVYLIVLMTFAWSLGSVCKELGTAYYIVDLTSGFLNPAFLPVILFVVAALMSLATGSSWGPYAILMPIGIPVSMAVGAPLFVTVAAIISGGLFGDHCSPLSDTTILASMGAACDHIDHFETQFPYALTAAFVSGVLFLIAGFIQNAIILIIPGFIALALLIYVLHINSVKKYNMSSIVNEDIKKVV